MVLTFIYYIEIKLNATIKWPLVCVFEWSLSHLVDSINGLGIKKLFVSTNPTDPIFLCRPLTFCFCVCRRFQSNNIRNPGCTIITIEINICHNLHRSIIILKIKLYTLEFPVKMQLYLYGYVCKSSWKEIAGRPRALVLMIKHYGTDVANVINKMYSFKIFNLLHLLCSSFDRVTRFKINRKFDFCIYYVRL